MSGVDLYLVVKTGEHKLQTDRWTAFQTLTKRTNETTGIVGSVTGHESFVCSMGLRKGLIGTRTEGS